MANFSHYPLQQAIYQQLTGNPALTALISGVFDRPPEGSVFPYVSIGEASGSDWSSKTTTGMEHILTIHTWSREGGRKEAAQIMEQVHTSLHQASFSVIGQTLVIIRFVSSNIMLENDGWTYHGIMQFKALLQAN